MSQWFVKKPNETRQGPFSDAELKRLALSGTLARSDLIWCEGLDMAIPAGGLPGLFPPPQRITVPETPVESPIEPRATEANTIEEREEEEDVFSWYRPGDARAPLIMNWIDFWQFVHWIGHRNKRLYDVLPLLAAMPLGLLLGVVGSYIPLVLLNYIVLIGAGIVFGESIYECLRLKNGGRLLEGKTKIRALLFGFGAALLLAYFYTIGSFVTDLHQAGIGKNVSMLHCLLPWNIVNYIQIKSQAMVVARFTELDKTGPQFVVNCVMIAIEYFILILVVTSAAGGGRRNVQQV